KISQPTDPSCCNLRDCYLSAWVLLVYSDDTRTIVGDNQLVVLDDARRFQYVTRSLQQSNQIRPASAVRHIIQRLYLHGARELWTSVRFQLPKTSLFVLRVCL